jgi:hypothetical protein
MAIVLQQLPTLCDARSADDIQSIKFFFDNRIKSITEDIEKMAHALGKTHITTGIRAFAECRPLCRVPFLGHSAKTALPRAALGKARLSVTSVFRQSYGFPMAWGD